MEFSYHHDPYENEYVLKIESKDGDLIPFGAANGEIEAKLVCKTLNLATHDSRSQQSINLRQSWQDYLNPLLPRENNGT